MSSARSPRSAGARDALRREALDRRAGRDAPSRRRRTLLLGGGLTLAGTTLTWMQLGPERQALTGWITDARAAEPTEPDAFSVQVPLDAPTRPGKPGLLGHNIQWVDRGDDLLAPDGQLRPEMLPALQALQPTVLRFPGGAQSDAYHWERGMGAQAQRPSGEHFHSREQKPSTMGTAEFLDLCLLTGARPLLTVNVPSGSPDEAARWVRAVNIVGLRSPRTGERLPRVTDWEIGNEPYLKDDAQPALSMEPEAFAAKADACIRAMRAVDPTIRIGLPLSTDQRNGVPVVHFKRWAERMLLTLREKVDVACVHNAYLPFAYDRLDNPDAIYWATLAGARSVVNDLDALHALIARVRPGLKLPVALTEYHAIFSLGRGPTDEWTGSPLAALYIADLLRTLADRDDVLWANLWSLSGNWRFGAIQSGGWLRPVGQVLELLGPVLRGQRLPATGQAETVATLATGIVPAQPRLPLVETLVTRLDSASGARLQVLLIHKHPRRRAIGRLDLSGGSASLPSETTARLTLLHAPDPLRSDDAPDLMTRQTRVVELTRSGAGVGCTLHLPPACVAVLDIDLPRPTAHTRMGFRPTPPDLPT